MYIMGFGVNNQLPRDSLRAGFLRRVILRGLVLICSLVVKYTLSFLDHSSASTGVFSLLKPRQCPTTSPPNCCFATLSMTVASTQVPDAMPQKRHR